MKISKTVLFLLMVSFVLASVGTIAVTGILTTSTRIGSSGSIKAINVEIYWDIEGTQLVSQVDWGSLKPGESLNNVIYIKNTGNTPANLKMACTGWEPLDAENYITLSWDKEGEVVDSGEVVEAVLTLSVSDSISGITDYSFEIVIEGKG